MTAVQALRRSLPRGRSLPDDVWERRHRAILILLWLHAAAIPIYALVRGMSPLHAALEGLVLPAAALLAASSLPRLARMVAASLGLLTASGLLVHLSGGLIEMHFHFFVMVTVVALYQDWIPFLTSIGYVLVHHGIAGAIDPMSVFNHPAAVAHPWKWAAIHALFIAGISAVCLVWWRVNEMMLDQRRLAEERLREETRVVETLNHVGKSLAAELDLRSVVQHVTDAATELTGAEFGAFFYNVTDASGESYMLYTISGADPAAFESFGMPRNTPLFATTFSGEGVVRVDDVTADPRYGQMEPHHGMPKGHLPVRSYLAVPVHSRTGGVIGGLFFGHAQTARFDEVDERLAIGIASHASVAIDNAFLYESERTARSVSEEAQRRLGIMAEASRVLSSSLELEQILNDFAHVIAPAIADDCQIYLVDEPGEIELAAAYVDAETRAAWRGEATYRPDRSNQGDPVVRAVTGNVPVVVESFTKDELARAVPPEVRGALPFVPRSVIVVPLSRRDEVIGALAVGTNSRSDRTLRPADLPLVEDLGRRVAIAVENAKLYSTQRTAADTLQHSLLPDQLPDVPGLAMSARYVPGGPGIEVGGDWYDVIALPDGSIGLAMGDVVGRGVGAASLMGQLRNALRAYALEGSPPTEVLARLNKLLHHGNGDDDPMATLVFAVLDPESGILRVASAGHPPPLVVGTDGSVSYVDDTVGVPLGAMFPASFTETLTVLEQGGTLLLYTDGLVEDRELPLADGLELLATTVASLPSDLDELCDGLLERSPARVGSDDLALLAVRVLPMGARLELRLPARPWVLRPLRATLRRWLQEIGATEVESYEILVATCEACTNAIQHAGVSTEDFELTADFDDGVTITVRDHGTWRSPRVRLDGGRGLDIMRGFTDEAEFIRTEEGTEVRLRRALGSRREVPTI